MKQTMLLKLAPAPEQQTALLETLHAFNDACNRIAEVAYTNRLANKYKLQKLVYADVRKQYWVVLATDDPGDQQNSRSL